MWWNAKWKHNHWGYLLITPPAVISLPHPPVSIFPSLFPDFFLSRRIIPTSQRNGYWQIERGRINCHLAFSAAGAAFFQTNTFGLGDRKNRKAQIRRAGGGGWTGGRCKNRLHPAVGQDVQPVWATCVSHLPQHNFSCPSYKYTGEKLPTKGELLKFLAIKQRSAIICG